MGRPARLGHENQQGSGANLPFYILQLFTIFGTDYLPYSAGHCKALIE